MNKRVLISTLSAQWGGVITMLEFVTSTLVKQGYEPVLAYYEPYRFAPELSVPSYRLGQRRPKARKTQVLGGFEAHAIGAWLPEFEFTHYHATRHWKDLMEGCGSFMGVSGNIMVATPFWQTSRPFLSWVATAWEEDRKDRVKHFSTPRRWLDRSNNAPKLRKLEYQLIRQGKVLALSDYTRDELNRIGGSGSCEIVMPMPVERDLFAPDSSKVVKNRIGFSGRLDDPRKNLALLLRAAKELKTHIHNFEIVLIGGALPEDANKYIKETGLQENINAVSHVPRAELVNLLKTLEVYVVPSHQEGLCIAALEAMACGCPVVSTRCGGPEEYVRDDETGFLVNFDAGEMADAIKRIISNGNLRQHLSEGARQLVVEHYNRYRCENIFWESFETTAALEKGTLN